MTRNQIVICVKHHLENIYPSDNHMQNAIDIMNEFEELIRADERANVIDLIDRHLWNYSKEVWADFQSVLEKLKEQNIE